MGIRVETDSGSFEGLTRAGVHAFLGIPFAEAPGGERRWRTARPVQPASGTHAANGYGPAAPQNPPVGLFANSGFENQSEDCLNLNVWTPALDGERRPVLLWLHGGGFIFGSGASPLYDGSRLVERGDVVVVTINYRLGILGFLAHPALADEDAGGTIGNWGLLDQVEALRWVRRNIAAFGGDPGNVTIFGESAGGMSVADLMTAPAARGLFHKAIVQSGPPLAMTLERAEEVAGDVLDRLGLGNPAWLRGIAVPDLLRVQAEVAQRRRAGGLPFIPVGDGVSLPADPRREIARGVAADIPLLIGCNRDEAKAMMAADPEARDPDAATMRSKLAALFMTNGLELDLDEVIAGYKAARTARGEPVEPRELWSAIETDRIFRLATVRTAEAHSRHQPRTFTYHFEWESPAWGGALGACHALEIPFVFGNLAAPRIDAFAGSGPEAEALSQSMMDAWIAFARYGDPSTTSVGRWPGYDAERRLTMVFGRQTRVESAPYEEERRLWFEAGATAGRTPAR